eukprot:331953_1
MATEEIPVQIGDTLNGRYRIESKQDTGYYSSTWLATDLFSSKTDNERFVTLKIQKSGYSQIAKHEKEILSSITQPTNHVVKLKDSFDITTIYGNHIVFVFAVFGKSLLDLIRAYNFRGLPIAVVKQITRQILLGLDYLHNKCDIIHTDIKPENIIISPIKPIDPISNNNQDIDQSIEPMFEYIHGRDLSTGKLLENIPAPPTVKICNLDYASFTDNHYTNSITTRQYRAPEAILNVNYNSGVDLWSLGCMVFELITGDYLFDPKEGISSDNSVGYSKDEDHLALIAELMGFKNDLQKVEFKPWPHRWTNVRDKRFNLKSVSDFDEVLKEVRAKIERPGFVSSFLGGYKEIKTGGFVVKWDYTFHGDQLSRLQTLDYWSLAAVLEEKYKIAKQRKSQVEMNKISKYNRIYGHNEAVDGCLASFIGAMIRIDPLKRCTVKQMLKHKWLDITAWDVAHCFNSEMKWLKERGELQEDTNASKFKTKTNVVEEAIVYNYRREMKIIYDKLQLNEKEFKLKSNKEIRKIIVKKLGAEYVAAEIGLHVQICRYKLLINGWIRCNIDTTVNFTDVSIVILMFYPQ